MKKEELVKLGLTEEMAGKVETASMEELKEYIPKSRFDEVNAELKQAKESVKERDSQLETLKSESGAAEKLKKQIADYEAANAEKDKAHTAELLRLRREALDEKLLREAGAIDPMAVKPFLAAVDAGVDDEGYAAVRAGQIDALTKTESKKFLFKAAAAPQFQGVKPGETGTTAPQGGGNPFAKGEGYNEEEQIKLFRENPELARTYMRQAGLIL